MALVVVLLINLDETKFNYCVAVIGHQTLITHLCWSFKAGSLSPVSPGRYPVLCFVPPESVSTEFTLRATTIGSFTNFCDKWPSWDAYMAPFLLYVFVFSRWFMETFGWLRKAMAYKESTLSNPSWLKTVVPFVDKLETQRHLLNFNQLLSTDGALLQFVRYILFSE